MSEQQRPDDPQAHPRSLLSREEIHDLLSPLAPIEDGEREPVLLLSDRPEDAEAVSAFLSARGVPLVPASHRFAALDYFRQRRYAAVVASLRSLSVEAEGFVQRLREGDARIRIALLCEADDGPLPAGVTRIERPVTRSALLEFFAEVVPSEEDTHRIEMGPDTSPGEASAEDGASAARSTHSGDLPDALTGVRVLLEARLRGEGLEAGLRRWIASDPAVGGIAMLELEGRDTLRCRVVAGSEEARRTVLRAAVDLDPAGVPGETAVELRGNFLLFREHDSPRRCLAVYAGSEAAASAELARLAPRLAPLLRVIEEIPLALAGEERRTPADLADENRGCRARFVALLDSRLAACERGGRRLVLLLAERTGTVQRRDWDRRIRKALRGSDWLEEWGGRAYGILELSSTGSIHTLRERLGQVQRTDQLRIAAVGWGGEQSGREYLESVEEIFREPDRTGSWLEVRVD